MYNNNKNKFLKGENMANVNYYDLLNDSILEQEMEKIPYLLTQYEQGGCIDESDLSDLIKNEFMDVEDFLFIKSEHEEETGSLYFENEDYEINEIFYNMKPMEIIRTVYYGKYNFMDEYAYFNGYGNLCSCSPKDIAEEIKEDLNIIFEDEAQEQAQELINKALEMVQKGY